MINSGVGYDDCPICTICIINIHVLYKTPSFCTIFANYDVYGNASDVTVWWISFLGKKDPRPYARMNSVFASC